MYILLQNEEYLTTPTEYDILSVGKKEVSANRITKKTKPHEMRPHGVSSLFTVVLPRLVVFIVSV